MSGRRSALLVGGLVVVATLVREWWCGRFDLSPDEAYYWLWSQRLDWAYFSKGPGVALAIRAGTALLGDTERGVRWLSPILALATTGLLWLLVRDALCRTTATASALTLQCVPLFSTGALLMTVDPLSVFFWTLALLCGWRGVRGGAASPWWLACGAASGMGFLCKYTNALVAAGILLALVMRRGRDSGASLPSGAALRIGLAFLPFALPPVLWNARQHWPTVRHLVERGGLERQGTWLQPRETLEFLVVHFGTWSPLVFAMMLAALPAIVRRARACEGTSYLLFASTPVLALYGILALHEAGEANWTGPGVLGLLPLAVDHWMPRIAASRAVRGVAAAGLALGALLGLVIANTSLLGLAGVRLAPRNDPSTRVRGWRETAAAVADVRSRLEAREGHRVPIVAHHYGLASELAFYGRFEPMSPGQPSVHVPRTLRPRNQFWFWPGVLDSDPALPSGAPAPSSPTVLFVADRGAPPDGFAESCEPLAERAIDAPAGTLRTIRAFRCTGLRAPAP